MSISGDTALELVVDGVIYQMQTTGGISRLFTETLPRMCELEKALHIIMFTTGSTPQTLPRHPHINHVYIPQIERYLRPWRFWKPHFPELKQIITKVRTGNIKKKKIWHSTYYTTLDKWEGPSVVTVYDMIHERFPQFFINPGKVIEQKKRALSRADVIICISEVTCKDLQEYYGFVPEGVRIIYPGFSNVFELQRGSLESAVTPIKYGSENSGCTQKYSQRRKPSRGFPKNLQNNEIDSCPTMLFEKPYLLYVGSRASYKGFDDLLSAYSAWSERDDVILVVVGEKWSSEEEKKLREHKIGDGVKLIENVNDVFLRHLYNQAVSLVFPSLYEGLGIPLLEAMACGCPIVASRIPTTIEVARNVPIYFEPGKAEDLLVALDHILSEGRDSLRSRIGLEYVKQYSWVKAARQTLEVYRSLT